MNNNLVVTDSDRIETMMELRHALNQKFERWFQAGRAEWERRFADNDPADACVRVRVFAINAAVEPKALNGSTPAQPPTPPLSIRHCTH